MADGAQVSPRRFSAFISYSSRDVALVRRLHHDLEMYRLPGRLADKVPAERLRGRRLKPIFRDIADLSAESDLTAAIRDALAQSDNLIVVCSPNSAKSEWVRREIEYFRGLHGDGRIRAALIDGHAADAFPAALRRTREGAPIEPLAADFTPRGPGRKLALLKLIAGMTDVPLDELVQRDAQRRMRRVVAGSAAAVLVTLSLSAGAIVTLQARQAAELQRAKAQALVGSMLDLRGRLKRMGKLDLLASVNSSALDYYVGQDLSQLSVEALDQRARLLQAIGEDEEKRGHFDNAQTQFEEAKRTTAALLAADPQNPQRIFAHSQSEYWVGFASWRRGDIPGAKHGFQAYAALVERLVRREPGNFDWIVEAGNAESNLGMLALRHEGDLMSAERYFTTALQRFVWAQRRKPADTDTLLALADAHAWVADVRRLRGDLDGAQASRAAQRQLIDGIVEAEPTSMEARIGWLSNELAMARIDSQRGRFSSALARLNAGRDLAVRMTARDPENAEMAKQARAFELFRIKTILAMRPPRAEVDELLARLGACDRADKATQDAELADFCNALHGRLLSEKGARPEAAQAFARIRRASLTQPYSARWGLKFSDEIPSDVGEWR